MIKSISREEFYRKLEQANSDFKDFIGKEIKVYSNQDILTNWCGIIVEIKLIKQERNGFKSYFRIKFLRPSGEFEIIIIQGIHSYSEAHLTYETL